MQTPLAIAASLLAVLIWLISRRRPVLHRPRTAAAPVAAIGRVVPAASVGSAQPPAAGVAAQVAAGAATSPRQRLHSWRRAMADPSQRLALMQQLGACPERASLPVLELGLRDPSLSVMRAAATAMEAFRGRTAGAAATKPGPVAAKLPRNAAPRS